MSLSYRERKRAGLVRSMPRRMTAERAATVRRKYFAREGTQKELALEFSCQQSLISRIVSEQIWT